MAPAQSPIVVHARVWPHNHRQEFGGPLDLKIGVSSQPDALRGWNAKNKPLFNLEQPLQEESNLTLLRVLFLKHGTKPACCPHDIVWHRANVWGLQELPVPPVDALHDDDGSPIPPERRTEFVHAWRKIKPTHITVYLSGRHVSALPHPVPLGQWEGTVVNDPSNRWVLFTFQAVTLAVQKKEVKRHILLPGDAAFDSITEYTKAL